MSFQQHFVPKCVRSHYLEVLITVETSWQLVLLWNGYRQKQSELLLGFKTDFSKAIFFRMKGIVRANKLHMRYERRGKYVCPGDTAQKCEP